MGRPSGCGDTSHYCTCTLPGLPVKWTAMYTLSRISKVLLSSSFAVTYTAAANRALSCLLGTFRHLRCPKFLSVRQKRVPFTP